SLEKIEKAAKSSVELTRQILTFARKQEAAPQQIDLNETVNGLLGMMKQIIGEDVVLTWKPNSTAAWVHIDPVQVDQTLANLLLNARDAIAGVGTITVEITDATVTEGDGVSPPEALPGDYVVLRVNDDGCGMDKETLKNIFEPFFTTKDTDKGTGLGLSTVYGIVKQNNGFIHVHSSLEQGTTFEIYLPECEEVPALAGLPTADEFCERGQETILIVEDEGDLLDLCKFMLESTGYQVFTAQTPEAAIQIVEEHKDTIHLVITDVVLPTMNGRELVANLLSHDPNLKVLYMSGYTADTIAHRGILDPEVHFLQKPFSNHLLIAKVQGVLHDA
ncbi:MAG: response regulator, partial [Candidatus Hydrogenedentes bacterium]|nr:response regulator [Candidatus Hydrogenedentota bacterium]